MGVVMWVHMTLAHILENAPVVRTIPVSGAACVDQNQTATKSNRHKIKPPQNQTATLALVAAKAAECAVRLR
jgi:hypothetical protein